MATGCASGIAAKQSIPSSFASVSSWSIAAGRYTSQLTSSTFLRASSRTRRASFAAVVVLPAPCKPASRITAGGVVARFKGTVAPPISAANSRCTTPTSAWPGESEPSTSWPTALSRTAVMNCLTTGSATSASSKASRISRRASWMLFSVRRASPRSVFMARPSRCVRLSNMGIRLVARGRLRRAVGVH